MRKNHAWISPRRPNLCMCICSYLVACNITAAILEMAAIYLQLVNKGDNEEVAPVLPGVVLVALDVAVQVLLYSSSGAVFAAVTAYGAQIRACTSAAGHFCEQVHRAKLVGLGASFAAARRPRGRHEGRPAAFQRVARHATRLRFPGACLGRLQLRFYA